MKYSSEEWETRESAARKATRTIDPHHNYATCGGPRTCRYCRSMLSETNEQTAERLNAENHARRLRTAGEFRAGVALVCGCGDCQKEERTMRGIPDPYEADLAKLRAAQGITLPAVISADDPRLEAMAHFRGRLHEQSLLAALQARPSTSRAHLEPPNGYAIAIERMKEANR